MVRCLRCASLCADGHTFCFACGAELGPASQRSEKDALIGRTLPGGYRVTHLVGVGGMGRVYCAEQVALGRTVAVKVVHPHLADDELAAARFLNEARAASRLSHPNSVAIFDFGRTDDGQPYIVMEYLRGRDLGRVAQTEGPLPLRRVVEVLRQTLAALGEAHALGIVHRDLKPDNIVLEPMRSGLDFVKVVDFGLAKLLGGEATRERSALTRPGLVCGTPEYMSPEQGRGDELDGRSDLYSVGVVLFELLAGCQPFLADSATKTLLLHLTEPAPDPRDVAPDRAIPAAFAELALRSLAKSREDRFQTATAFADALEQALVDTEGRHPLDSAPSTAIRCGHCGGLSPLGQKYCGECGASITPTPPAPSSAVPRPLAPRRSTDPARAPTSFVPSQAALRPLPFVGRDEVLRWLEARRDDAAAMPATAHLVGELGIGKTRLIDEALGHFRDRGDHVVRVSADPTWAKVGDAALVDAVAGLLEKDPAAPTRRLGDGAPADAAQGLALLFDPSAPQPADAHERRQLVAQALRWALERASGRAGVRRVVLAVDDLDFVDGASRNAFVDVVTAMPPVPALVIVAYTPRAKPFADEAPGEVYRLEPLPYETFGGWLSPRLAVRDAPLSPLHVEHLLAWARETTEPPPERLAEIITRRSERLPTEARLALHAIAVWGDNATVDLVRGLLPPATDAAATNEALAVLERGRWIVRTGDTLQIAHPLARRVAFSSIPAGLKSDLFARAAALRPRAPLEVKARQAMYGDSALEALALLDALSTRRAAHGDLDGSVSALRHALDLARRELHRDELDDPVGAILTFSRKLAEALAAAERWSDAEGVLREALDSAPPTSEHRAHLLGVMAQVAGARRQLDEARRYLDEAMRVARQSDARALIPVLERIDRSIAVA
jgi:serine/threonine-protein kinase